jgi:hypothetical protein
MRFVALPYYMLNSEAYLSLPGDALKIYVDVAKRYNGVNNGEISYGVREAAEIGISKTVAARMLEILAGRGFLVVTRNSDFRVKSRATRVWRLTNEPYRGTAGTRDFTRWQPPSKIISQSPHRDTQSLHRDKGNKITSDGPSTGTVSPKNGDPQSLHRDTYTYTMLGASDGGAAAPTCTSLQPDGSACDRPVIPGLACCPVHALKVARR